MRAICLCTAAPLGTRHLKQPQFKAWTLKKNKKEQNCEIGRLHFIFLLVEHLLCHAGWASLAQVGNWGYSVGGKQQHQALSALVSTASSSRSACSSPVEAHPIGRDVIHTIRIFPVSSCWKMCFTVVAREEQTCLFLLGCCCVFVCTRGISRTGKNNRGAPSICSTWTTTKENL